MGYLQYTVEEELDTDIINAIVNELVENGAECIILGCTEILLLISQDDFVIPVFDTTKIHSQAIVNFALS